LSEDDLSSIAGIFESHPDLAIEFNHFMPKYIKKVFEVIDGKVVLKEVVI
jgi:hypothetical protein